MNFQEAIEELKKGKKVRLPLMDKGNYLFYEDDEICWQDGGNANYRLHQLEATDWEVVEEKGCGKDEFTGSFNKRYEAIPKKLGTCGEKGYLCGNCEQDNWKLSDQETSMFNTMPEKENIGPIGVYYTKDIKTFIEKVKKAKADKHATLTKDPNYEHNLFYEGVLQGMNFIIAEIDKRAGDL